MTHALDWVAQAVHWFFPEVPEVTPQELAAQLNQTSSPVLLDAREADEFEVSHLQGAFRVPPGASAEEVLALLGPATNRPVVVYCAVGGRSALLTKRTQQALLAAGATNMAHLRGGIFAWHAAGLPLFRNNIPTQQVHPYNLFWGRLMKPPGFNRTSP